jgi:2-octaprenyl-6-methoxyphenol hydroxylase
MINKYNQSPTAIVIGGGPAGLTAAISLAESGIVTALAGKQSPRNDNRTTALLAGSVTALATLGVWELCADQAAPLRSMRLVDDTGRLWRAPEVKFSANEIGLDAFGYNIENRHLVRALAQKASDLPLLQLIDENVSDVASRPDTVTIKFNDGRTLSALLAIGADGRSSICRAAAGISIDEHTYPQVALTVSLRHSRPHGDISTEFHTPSGPFTLVPLPNNRSSLVWVLESARAEELAVLPDGALAAEIERASHSILGKVELESACGLFPLRVATARRFADKRIALVGEAAHVIPPIGAQGLNLGLRDAATIGELAVAARRNGRDIGGPDLLTRYDQLRRSDIDSRTLAVDLLNRSLLTDFLPVQGVRGVGLYMLDRIGPLRRAVMREGLAPSSGQPRLMRGERL